MSARSPLDEAAITARLAALAGWTRDANRIRKAYTFPSFAEGIAFVNRVAALADEADHHPDILVEYTRVTLTLSTHDAGGLTERDFRLAAEVDAPPGP